LTIPALFQPLALMPPAARPWPMMLLWLLTLAMPRLSLRSGSGVLTEAWAQMPTP
jgi:hypothetical protein